MTYPNTHAGASIGIAITRFLRDSSGEVTHTDAVDFVRCHVIAVDREAGVIAVEWDTPHAGGHGFDTLDISADYAVAWDERLPRTPTRWSDIDPSLLPNVLRDDSEER